MAQGTAKYLRNRLRNQPRGSSSWRSEMLEVGALALAAVLSAGMGEAAFAEGITQANPDFQGGQAPLAEDVSSQSSLLSRAQTALRQERYEEATELWQQLVEKSPDSAEMSYNLGVANHRLFQIEDAAKAYWTATVLNPEHREAHVNLSLALIQLGRYEEAMRSLDHLLTLPDRPSDPASIHAMAHYNRAVILGREGKIEESLAAVNAALAISPDFTQATELIDIIR